MSRNQLTNVAHVILIGALGLTTSTCAPMRAMGTSSWKPTFMAAPDRGACTTEWREHSSLTAVRARVDLRRRVLPLEEGAAPLDPRIGILARELCRPRKLERGTVIEVVYRVVALRPASKRRGCSRAGASADARIAVADFQAKPRRELLAVQVGSGPTVRIAFHVESEVDGTDGFYARDGRPLERAFLRYPVEYMLVTSGFSYGRAHPILKKRKPHLGVDFAAPRGTPVVAVADGEVIEAGWAGYHGRHVGIRHADGSTSGYSHLERITPGVGVGARVSKGDVIGAVGTSGLATGPHLHFSVTRRGKPVDPLAAETPSLARLNGAALARLRASAAEVDIALAAPEPDAQPFQLVRGATAVRNSQQDR